MAEEPAGDMHLHPCLRGIALAPLLLLAAALGHAAEAEGSRPKIALVLSGGGARGAAHVGVIRQLEELHIPVDLVVGTSMGSIVGSLYAAGYTADEIEAILRRTDWLTVLSDSPPRDQLWFRRRQDDRRFQVDLELGWHDGGVALPPGFIIGLNTEAYLEELLLPVAPIQRFDALPIPFRCVATDELTGRAVALEDGSLATAVRASLSLPGIYAPVVVQGRTLIDGGVVDNLPIRLAQHLGADVVIAVDIAPRDDVALDRQSAMGVFNQSLRILMQENRRASLEALRDRDLLIHPEVSSIGLMEFGRYAEAIELGHEAASAMQPRLAPLGVGEEEYRGWRARVMAARPPAPLIRSVRIEGTTGLSDAVIAKHVAIQEGAPLAAAEFRATREQVAGIGVFQRVEIALQPVASAPGSHGPEETDVVVTPVEKSWGRNYFRFGISVSSDLRGGGDFEAGIQHTLTPIDGYGGEWRNELQVGTQGRAFTEIYQPLDAGLRWFVAPHLEYDYGTVPIIVERRSIAEYQVDRYTAGFDAGRNLGYWGELRFGYEGSVGNAKPKILPPGLPRDTVRLREQDLNGTLTVDTLDSSTLPSGGLFGELQWTTHLHDADEGDRKSIASARLAVPITFGSLTFTPALEGGRAMSGDPGFSSEFTLGGFRRLSGLAPTSITGDNLLLGVLQTHYRLGRRTTLFGVAPFIGATVEAGNAWQRREDVSLSDLLYSGSGFIGAETFIGPCYLGCGYTEGGEVALYLFIGPVF